MKLNLGENIRENRRRLGLTQEQLADRLGVSFQSVSRWETGTTYPDMETLPELAKLFDTTIDALVGYVPEYKSENKRPSYEDIASSLHDAMHRNAWNECVGFVRLIRNEYFDELDKHPIHFFNAILVCGVTISSELLEEFRRMNEAIQEKAKNNRLRANMIQYMAKVEDDGQFLKLVESYSALDERTTMEELYMHRYRIRGELEKYEKLRIVKKYRQLKSFIFDHSDIVRTGVIISSQERDRFAALLGMLNSLCMIKPDEKHPVSGNGKVDFLAEMRIKAGTEYAVYLCASGEREGALTAVEDVADMIGQLDAMELDGELTCSAPEFCGLTLHKYKDAVWSEQSGKKRKRLDFYQTPDGESFAIAAACCIELGRCLDRLTKYDDKNISGTILLDPIRDDPRFKEAYRRIEECVLRDGE